MNSSMPRVLVNHVSSLPNAITGITVYTWRLLEAQSYGRPVVSSDLPVPREVTEDGALFFDPDDDARLADIIERLFVIDQLCEELSLRSRENVRRFSSRKAAEEVEAVFDRHLPPHYG